MKHLQTSTDLISRLQSTLIRQRLVLFSAGMLLTIAVVLSTWIGLTLLANVVVLPIWLKLVLLSTSAVLALYFVSRFALKRLFDGSIDSVAMALERRYPDMKGRLVAAVQFARTAQRQGFSPELVRATEEQAIARAGGMDFGSVITFNPIMKSGRMFLGAVAIAVAVFIIAPGMFNYAVEVYSNPTSRIAPPVAYSLTATPGTTEWIKYRDLTIGGALVGLRLPEKATIHHRLAGGNWQTTEIDLRKLGRTAIAGGDSVGFGVNLRQVYRSLDYYVEAGDLATDIHQINVVDRPRVVGLNLSIFYPDYTGLEPTVIDELNGSFSAVVGSRVNLKLETNQPVATAELVFEDSSRTPFKVEGTTAEASLVVEQSRSYRIELVNKLGEQNPDPIEYYITAVPDEYPSIDVLRPGFDVNLGDEMVLPLLVRIFDDYGFSSLVMKFQTILQGRASDEHVAVLHFSEKIKTQGDVEFNWDMDRLNLFPGDYVSYYFEVADNDRVSGPKVSRSRKYIARVPSLEEIVAQTEKDSRQRINQTEELLRQGEELTKRLKDAARKLEAKSAENKSSEWSEQKELEAIAQSHEQMLQQIQELAENMDRSLEQLQESSLMSREIMERLEEIQKLFEEVATPEMREAQRQLQEALQSMDPQQLEQAMRNMEMSQDELMQRLDRTLALLKMMQVRQKMESMVRRAEELVERQEATNNEAKESSDESLPELSKAEQQTKQGLESLKKDADDLQQLMKEAGVDQAPEAQDFLNAVRQSDAGQNMQKMSDALQQKRREEAGKEGSEAQSKLLSMLDKMRQQQMAMTESDSEEVAKEMRRALDHASHLSQDQESLINDAQAIDPRSVVVREMAGRQDDLKQSCSGLMSVVEELGRKSPFLGMEIRSLVNTAVQNMGLAVEGFDGKLGAKAVTHQTDAMYHLNRVASRLMESLDQQQQCDNPDNQNQSFSQMEKLCNKQNQLNQMTQQQCNNPGQCNNPRMGSSGMPSSMPQSEGQRQGMERLAAEQGAIRKSLQQLEQEFGGSRQVLGRLSDIADEMRQVEESLQSGQAGPETTERQLKIYSRMLEASRSLQRKDYSEQRRATTASEQPVYLPQAFPPGLFDDEVKLEDRLRQFMGDSYPPQYEEQIKAYFKALLKSEAEARNGEVRR